MGDPPMTDLPALDPTRIYPTYVGSNELSPFHRCYANDQTVLRLAAGRFFAHHNGDDPVAGYWALRRHAALYDVPERPVEVSGPDAVPFLEHILARRIADMAEGRGRYVLACTHQGGVFMDGILFRLAADRFWFVQPDGDMHTWMLAHNLGFEVRVTDPKSRALQLQGPRSFDVMHTASGGTITQAFGFFHAGFFDLGGQSLFVSRTGWTGELGYEIYTLGEDTDAPRLWAHLMEAGKEHGVVFSSMQSMNIRRIEAGILDSGSDFDTTMTPFEAGLDRFVDLSKDAFVGREALLTAPRGKRLFGIKCDDLRPAGGYGVFEGDTQVGRVTTGAASPCLQTGIGYVRFERAGQWIGHALTLRSPDGREARCEIVDLPFFDPKKSLSRSVPV